MTPIDTICEIMTDLWLNFREDEEVKPLVEYFDIGFPLAFAHKENLAELTEQGYNIVSATWWGLLESLGIAEDTGFESLSDLLALQ